MELEVYNHKVALVSFSEEEFSELKRALRIWYRDRFGGLQNHILLNFKEKTFPSGYLETVLEKLKKKNIIPVIKDGCPDNHFAAFTIIFYLKFFHYFAVMST